MNPLHLGHLLKPIPIIHHHRLSKIISTANNRTQRIASIHIGESTQTQLHVIKPNSFNTMNTIVNRPVNPIPPLTVVLCLSLILPHHPHDIPHSEYKRFLCPFLLHILLGNYNNSFLYHRCSHTLGSMLLAILFATLPLSALSFILTALKNK